MELQKVKLSMQPERFTAIARDRTMFPKNRIAQTLGLRRFLRNVTSTEPKLRTRAAVAKDAKLPERKLRAAAELKRAAPELAAQVRCSHAGA